MDPFCCSEEDINPTNAAMATVCLILNIFLPGFGTILNACLGVRVLPGLIYGFLQILLAPILIGWVWSIIYGIKIMQRSGKERSVYYYETYVPPTHYPYVVVDQRQQQPFSFDSKGMGVVVVDESRPPI